MKTNDGDAELNGDTLEGWLDRMSLSQPRSRAQRHTSLKQATKKDADGRWVTSGRVRVSYSNLQGETCEQLEENFARECEQNVSSGAEWCEGFAERESVIVGGRLVKLTLARTFRFAPVEPQDAGTE